ncbi:MAG: hypothetical protein KGD59_08035 [Candidatus Heimdallarchaeota archaeon]|nr:hypothetical protein [Candidatus Heimdallarchaeota archaeon]MBY8994486.1 hypothetical protein [Candidatus Heimdallarchaeota archaeon]
MTSKKYLGILTWAAIIAGLGLAGFGLYRYGFVEGSNFDYLFIIFGAALFVIGTVLFVANMKKQKKRTSTRIQTPTRTQRPISRSHRLSIEEDDEAVSSGAKIIASIVDYPIQNEKCMISKTEIQDDDEVLQCPFCSSYFIKMYLEEWLEKHKTCPVCQNILVEE